MVIEILPMRAVDLTVQEVVNLPVQTTKLAAVRLEWRRAFAMVVH